MKATDDRLDLTREVLDVSVTEMQAFRSCQRRWTLEVLDNLMPRIPPSLYLKFGNGMHEALAAYYERVPSRSRSAESLGSRLIAGGQYEVAHADGLADALEEFDAWFEDTVQELEDDDSIPQMTVEDLVRELTELNQLGHSMLKGYHRYSMIHDDFTVHSIEGILTGAGESWLRKHHHQPPYPNAPVIRQPNGRMLVPIVDPKTKEWLPDKPVLSMRIDLTAMRTSTGIKGVWVIDHKTSGQQPNVRGLEFDDQLTGYSYGHWRWLGVLPRGVCFNYLIKQAPKPPRILKKGELSTAKDQLTTAEQYREALIDHGLMLKNGEITSEKHSDAYAALLSRGFDPFFQRQEDMRNMEEILAFEERLFEQYQDMEDVFIGEREPIPNLSRWHCPGCAVAPICKAIEGGSDEESIIEHMFQQAPDRKKEF